LTAPDPGLSAWAYVAGVVLLLAVTASAIFAARRLRARLMPDATGALARLAEAVLAIGLVVAAELAAGAVGQFRRAAVCAMCVAAALVVGALAGSRGREGNDGAHHVKGPRVSWVAVVAVAAVAVVVAQWSTYVFASARHGILDVDSLDYHLTFAARFVQSGWITRLNFVDPETATTFHPANAELIHGLGMALFGRDLLSLVLNMGWLGLLLLAGWCIGRPFDKAPLTLLATAVMVAPALLAQTQPGTAQNDAVTGFFLVACVALLFAAEDRPGVIAVAAVAAALAVGTKLTALVPVLVLTIGVLIVAVRRQRAMAVAWAVPLAVLGSFWFVRNLVHVGNPVPALHVSLGGLSLPRPTIYKYDHFGYTVAHYLPDGSLVRRIFVPELRRVLGVAWPAILVLALAGLVLSVLQRRSPVHRMAGVAGLAAAAAYLVTPTTAGGPPGIPVLFAANLRYLWPALLLGLVLLPTCKPLAQSRASPWVIAVLASLFLATELSSGAWPAQDRGLALLVGTLVVLSAVLTLVVRGRHRRAALVGLGVLAACVIGYPAQRVFARDRYRDTGERLQPAYSWARQMRSARVAITGIFTQFPLYGPDLSNRVQYVGHHGPHSAFSVITTCREWREAVNRGRFQFVVTAPGIAADPIPPATAWTKEDRAAHQVVDTGGVAVFALSGPLDPNACRSP
jgi:hypothetical protein